MPLADQVTRYSIPVPGSPPLAVEACGSGAPVLLVHGTSADAARWYPFMTRTAAMFRTVALHRRGREGSEDRAMPHSVAAEGEDVAAAAATLGEGMFIVAHSFGAICTIEALAAMPAVRGLVLYEPPLSAKPRPVPPILRDIEELVAKGQPELGLETFFTRHMGTAPEALRAMRARPDWNSRIHSAHTVAREVRAACEYRLDAARIAAISTPVLLLEGTESHPLLREAVATLERLLPNARRCTLLGQGHFALDSAPDAFTQVVSTFLLDLLGRDGAATASTPPQAMSITGTF